MLVCLIRAYQSTLLLYKITDAVIATIPQCNMCAQAGSKLRGVRSVIQVEYQPRFSVQPLKQYETLLVVYTECWSALWSCTLNAGAHLQSRMRADRNYGNIQVSLRLANHVRVNSSTYL